MNPHQQISLDFLEKCLRVATLRLVVCLWVLALLVYTTPAAAQDSVCVRVKIEIEQTVTLERQAFRATMKINNGGESDLTGLRVAANFADEEGRPVAATTNAKLF